MYEKATICAKNNCVTVYGKQAKLVNTMTTVASLIILCAALYKVLK